MNVLALVPSLYDTSPGQRFRIEQWARYLEHAGCRFIFAPFEDEELHRVIYQPGRYSLKSALMLKAIVRRLDAVRRAREFDVVLIHREAMMVGPALIERLLATLGIPLVLDFDDAIWVAYRSPTNGWLSRLKCFGKTAQICRLSAHIIAGNSYLARYARQYNPNVTIVPTTIDTRVYTQYPSAECSGDHRLLTIGWTGSHSTVQYLRTLRPVLMKLRRLHEFRLSVIGISDFMMDGMDTVAQQWRAETEVEDLRRFDIGIVPIPDDEWARGKCAMKVLQYMALGIPAVGSRIRTNADALEDGVNGFLATTEDEWIEKLSMLITDSNLRHRMGKTARHTVEECYSTKVWAPKVHAVLESVITGAHRRSWSRTSQADRLDKEHQDHGLRPPHVK